MHFVRVVRLNVFDARNEALERRIFFFAFLVAVHLEIANRLSYSHGGSGLIQSQIVQPHHFKDLYGVSSSEYLVYATTKKISEVKV